MKISLRHIVFLVVATSAIFALSANAEIKDLPDREKPRPVTTSGIPHIQIDVEPVPEISEELLRQVAMIPGIDLRRTIVGRAGSTGFWVNDDIKLVKPSAIIRGREFAHLHPDGSLHASLDPDLAVRAVEAGWAIPHPWAASKRGMEGFVMIYTPASDVEMETVVQLVMESYAYVTGLDAAALK